MSAKRYSVGVDGIDPNGNLVKFEDYAALEQKLAESQREFRAADATIENLQMKLEKLAAENAGLMQLIDWPKQQCPTTGDVTDVEPADFIPSTSASLAEVRAQGADECVRQLVISDDDADAPNICAMVAHQLRKGVQS